jgi:predicted phage replisome organizer
MAEIKWIKLSIDIFNNRKIKQIECLPEGDAIIVIWVKLLCLAGTINDSGQIYFTKEIPYTDQMLANQFGRPLTTIQLALKTFEQFGMVEVIDNILCVSNWEKYQSVDRLSEIREYNRLAKQKQRQKKKLLQENVKDMSKTSQRCQDTDIDIDIEEDKEEDKENKSVSQAKTRTTRFTPPTLDEVRSYCAERKNSVDAQRFVDYYTSNGWLVGKNKMKDWRAAVRTWERNNTSSSKASGIAVKQNASDDLDGIF